MISVIIPVYNVESFLPRCLDSLIAQTYRHWEAVCVDDGSTDGSASILDSYALKDDRIRVFHIENSGVSNARNTAMANIRGEYVLPVDSDDFLHPQAMELCLRRIGEDGSDAVMFSYVHGYRTAVLIAHYLHLPEPRPVFRKFDCGKVDFLVSDDVFSLATEYSRPVGIDSRWAIKHCQPWRGMYRAGTVRDIKFIPGIIYEDFPWWSAVLLNIRRVTVLDAALYYYYPNSGGYIMSAPQQERIQSLRLAIEEAERLYDGVDGYRREQWRRNFLVPFRAKLDAKLKSKKP